MKIFLVLPFLLGCISQPPSNAPVQTTVKEGSLRLRAYEQQTLKNGLKIIFVHDDTLPRVSLSLIVKAGLQQESIPGVNAFTAGLLEQGTRHKTASEIADELGDMGTTFSVIPSVDFTMMSADALSPSAEKLFRLFSELIQKPSFGDAEINRLRSQTLAHIERKKENASGVADDYFDAHLFSGHPYQRDVEGTQKSIKGLKKKEIIQHYLSWYRPNNSLLAVVGAFDENLKTLIVNQMEEWSPKKIQNIEFKESNESPRPAVLVYAKKGLAQTQVRMGLRGIPRSDPDYLTLRLAFEILGGGLSSRLMQRVRDDLGLTYSIQASLDARLEPGAFTISTFTKNVTVGQTVSEAKKIIQEFVDAGPTEKELEAAQNQLMGNFPRALETADRYAGNLLALEVYGVPMTYLTEFNKNVKKVTVSEINRVLKKHIDLSKLKIVIYGDTGVEAQLQDLKPELTKL